MSLYGLRGFLFRDWLWRFSHQVSANLLISIIERIPACTIGSIIIPPPRTKAHYGCYLQGSFVFMFHFILSLCAPSSNRQTAGTCWILPLGINKVNRTSSYLISSHIHGIPTGNTYLAANKELVPWYLLVDLQQLFFFSILFFLSAAEQLRSFALLTGMGSTVVGHMADRLGEVAAASCLFERCDIRSFHWNCKLSLKDN